MYPKQLSRTKRQVPSEATNEAIQRDSGKEKSILTLR